MASSGPFKASSRWGSFLAGVESKLDTILADEPATVSSPAAKDGGNREQPARKDVTTGDATRVRGDSPSRQASTTRAQDRLTERLAKAVASRNLARKSDGSVKSSDLPSRTTSPANTTELSTSSESKDGDTKDEEGRVTESITRNGTGETLGEQAESQLAQASAVKVPPFTASESTTAQYLVDSPAPVSVRPSVELVRTASRASEPPAMNETEPEMHSKLSERYEQTIAQMKADHETAELRRQEEVHDYLERIDALQSKLQYLSKEAVELAKAALSVAKPGSLEQKLAQKDEKIALLIEEGQKLSQTELRHMSIIKKLRAKSVEDESKVAESKRLGEKHEKASREAQERAKRAELAERRAAEKTRILPKLEKELETLRQDREVKIASIQELQRQLANATSLAREAESQDQAESLQFEQRLTADLRDEIANLKAEKEQGEKAYRTEVRELKERAEREKERARLAAIERQGEWSIMESRLEAFRARAEEASAGTSGDVHAKLLRQIETLQNQYAIASENWQGIEGSLLTRITVVERERDEIAKRELDIRRKARDAGQKSRRLEEELEKAVMKLEETSYELQAQRTQLAALQEKYSKSEADIAAVKRELQEERRASASQQEEEKSRLSEEPVHSPDTLYGQFRTESPPVMARRNRKSSNERERASPHGNGRRVHGLAITASPHSPALDGRPASRRSSTQPFHHYPSELKPSRRESSPFVPQVSINGSGIIPPSPPAFSADHELFFDDDGVRTPATPERTINDMISGSTAGAGPSVQLVERMTAAVRRLESEKASLKEELIRLAAQRDEAREQVISLMQEVDEKRKAEERVAVLEKEVKGLEERYLTTLEMLGEKSETVEELKADVVDLKELYRELCERTMQ